MARQKESEITEEPVTKQEEAVNAEESTAKPQAVLNVALSPTHTSNSYWRAGIQFTKATQAIPLASLSEEQLALLKADKWLVIKEM